MILYKVVIHLVYLCFSTDSPANFRKCQVFDGEQVEELGVDVPSQHVWGALGLFLGKITGKHIEKLKP